jgi:hypothetical protein
MERVRQVRYTLISRSGIIALNTHTVHIEIPVDSGLPFEREEQGKIYKLGSVRFDSGTWHTMYFEH